MNYSHFKICAFARKLSKIQKRKKEKKIEGESGARAFLDIGS
jgi:hypothetical protein